jgi:hypothetical protein
VALPVAGQGNSVVTLSAAADSLRFVVNACPGKIAGELWGGLGCRCWRGVQE